MANKYTATPIPPKSDLERLYFSDFKTQTEIGEIYGVSQKVVFAWSRKVGIKSRIAFKRNQRGSNNGSWKGDDVTYSALHYRVQSLRGKANCCKACGRNDSNISYDWANISGNYHDVNDYEMLCRSCHFKKDGHKNNLPNRKSPANTNKRKLIDGK